MLFARHGGRIKVCGIDTALRHLRLIITAHASHAQRISAQHARKFLAAIGRHALTQQPWQRAQQQRIAGQYLRPALQEGAHGRQIVIGSARLKARHAICANAHRWGEIQI